MMRRIPAGSNTTSNTSSSTGIGGSNQHQQHHHAPSPRSNDRIQHPPQPHQPIVLPHGVPSSYHTHHTSNTNKKGWMYHPTFIMIFVCIVTIIGASFVVRLHHQSYRHMQVKEKLPQNQNQQLIPQQQQQLLDPEEHKELMKVYEKHHAVVPQSRKDINKTRITKDGRVIHNIHIDDIVNEFHEQEEQFQYKSVIRGVSGRPLEQTPSLKNAKRSHIECDINVDSLVYWNDNPSDYITTFHIPDKPDIQHNQQHDEQQNVNVIDEYYITFNPDSGGWNNIRMSMEIIFILAAATGRTLVLPPKAPLYLLSHDSTSRHRGFIDFFPINSPNFQKQIKIISFTEFLNRTSHISQFHIEDETSRKQVYAAADHCDKRDKSTENCRHIMDYLNRVGTVPNISAVDTCIIFDEHYYISGTNDSISLEVHDEILNFCGTKRHLFYWTNEFNTKNQLLHFRASERDYRLLTHYYGMIYFTNPAINHYYKRYVRDYLHYNDEIYCAAGKIVLALQYESKLLYDTSRDMNTGVGGYSSWHVRRGDLQYKKVKINAYDWYNNTKELYNIPNQPKEILYLATDERNKTFFNELYQYYDVRYLDDYWDIADLNSLDPNYMGMIDTIIASRAHIFVGTFFSTFTGYINRLRGYHGITMKDSYYSWLPRKYHMHTWPIVDDYCYSYEWPDGWIGIDSNVFPNKEIF